MNTSINGVGNNKGSTVDQLTGFQIDLVEFDSEFAEQPIDGLFDHFGAIERNFKRKVPNTRKDSVNDDIMDSTQQIENNSQNKSKSQRSQQLSSTSSSNNNNNNNTSSALVVSGSINEGQTLSGDYEEEEENDNDHDNEVNQRRVSVHTREVVNEVQSNSIYLKNRESLTEEDQI
eukprot:CAMPEP_0174820846 /NCGR_PEP_ID=MMETSP1107-20130205/4922_1 /TAXON_ID=36770 /ORGANISM="Paraphysomonas vestita, Strain GFlagA" /LENGTH=174 /DNA_ID=CAMNT_0016036949 /DNA_START=278 /DNA_END=802 /DNA_ORIENTATION=+